MWCHASNTRVQPAPSSAIAVGLMRLSAIPKRLSSRVAGCSAVLVAAATHRFLSPRLWAAGNGGRQRLGFCHDLHQVAVGIGEVQAPATEAVVDLAIGWRARPAAITHVLRLDTAEDRIELLVIDQERV